jgi:hypothetical protein
MYVVQKPAPSGGMKSGQVIADFVARYSDCVVGTPQDPALRALLIVGVALWVLNRWRQNKQVFVGEVLRPFATATVTGDDYRARLERDLQSRR